MRFKLTTGKFYVTKASLFKKKFIFFRINSNGVLRSALDGNHDVELLTRPQ